MKNRCFALRAQFLALLLGFIGLTVAQPVHARDRWAALSQLESGDDDGAIGAAGEVSRYQIKPELWRKYAVGNADWQKSDEALAVAKAIMS